MKLYYIKFQVIYGENYFSNWEETSIAASSIDVAIRKLERKQRKLYRLGFLYIKVLETKVIGYY